MFSVTIYSGLQGIRAVSVIQVVESESLTYLCSHECGRHVLELKHGERGQLLVNLLEDVVVEVPSLVQITLLATALILPTPLCSFRKLPAICLHRDASFRSSPFHFSI